MGSDWGEIAEIYDRYWGYFSQTLSEPIISFLDGHVSDRLPPVTLDLCCGTGDLALAFGRRGYRATGLDISKGMIAAAQRKLDDQGLEDLVRFIEADATDFQLNEPVSFVTSLFDALNHLADLDALTSCFRAARRVTRDGGFFVFDMLTLQGIRALHDELRPGDTEFYMSRGYNEPSSNRLVTQFFVFSREPNGYWKRYDHVLQDNAYPMDDVFRALTESGWSNARPVLPTNLSVDLGDAEAGPRTVVVAEAA